jgi:hypothetical protein
MADCAPEYCTKKAKRNQWLEVGGEFLIFALVGRRGGSERTTVGT